VEVAKAEAAIDASSPRDVKARMEALRALHDADFEDALRGAASVSMASGSLTTPKPVTIPPGHISRADFKRFYALDPEEALAKVRVGVVDA
jgi:hypothetical protein